MRLFRLLHTFPVWPNPYYNFSLWRQLGVLIGAAVFYKFQPDDLIRLSLQDDSYHMEGSLTLAIEAEILVFIDILFKYEGALSWEDSEMGMLDPAIEPPMEIHVVPHEPWQ